MNASTTSGAMNSALPTGVNNCGVATGLDSELLNLMPDPRSKSQTFIGVNLSGYTHKMFSGLRSLCAIPKRVGGGDGKRKIHNQNRDELDRRFVTFLFFFFFCVTIRFKEEEKNQIRRDNKDS